MKLTNVSLYSNNQEVANFNYRDSTGEGVYTAVGFEGLDADEIVSRFYGVSLLTNKNYHSLSLRKREFVVSIELTPDYQNGSTPSELRDNLYRAIHSSRTGLVEFRFNDNKTTVCAIPGFVTKFEADLFNKVPNVKLTVKTTRAMLHAIEATELDVVFLSKTNTISDFVSTAPHGFVCNFDIVSATPTLSFQDAVVPEWKFEITPLGGFLAEDSFYFSSVAEDRYVYIVRGGVTTQLVDRILPGSHWPIIFPKLNELEITTSSEIVWKEFKHYHTYWGV